MLKTTMQAAAYIEVELYEALKKKAKDEDQTISQLLRRFIRQGLGLNGKPKGKG